MPYKPGEREYRAFSVPLECREAEGEEAEQFIVEGYATTFNDPYRMFSFEGVDYFEEIENRTTRRKQIGSGTFVHAGIPTYTLVPFHS